MDAALKDLHGQFSEALDASTDQRRQIDEDLRFSDVANPEQWDDVLKRARESDPGGARPCLVFDQTGQYVQNVSGQVQQNPPAMHAMPVDGGADKKVAEQLDGFFRHIEHASRAQQHYARALTSAARTGVGYLIVEPQLTDAALGYQEPRISSEGDPMRVVFDPWSVEVDGSDATMGYLLTKLSHREFERRFGIKAAKVSWDDPDQTVRDERQSITVAKYWRTEERDQNLIICQSLETGEEMALLEDDYWKASQAQGQNLPVRGTTRQRSKVIHWGLASGAEMLEKERVFPADGIGIVPVYGYVSFSQGRMRYCGIPRRAMEPQRAYNFHMSEMRALMAAAPKAPWIVSTRAVKGLEALWDRASAEARAWLPYNDMDEMGPIPTPQRAAVAVNLANHAAGAEQALRDIQAAIGMYQANLGAPSNETSGVAISERKAQGEASTANFPANLAASITQVGRLIGQMVPKLVDTRRQLRILGIDSQPGQIQIDPGQDKAVQETPQGLVINPNVGKYDVRVTVGASFATQRSQAQQQFTELMRAAPNLMPAVAPLWAQTLDIQNSDKLAQVLTAVAPPEVRAVLQPKDDKEPSTAQLMAKVEQLGQALEQAIAVAKEAEQDLEQCEAKLAESEDKAAIAAYEAETKRLVGLKDAISPAQVQQLVVQTIEQMLSNPNPLPGEDEGEQPESYEMQPFPAGEQPEPEDMAPAFPTEPTEAPDQ
jgi:hypothetical protein